ncbi:von Willebrand factor A domain-containing protein 3B [Schistosoma japonicum]|nr:von Willebrand factor A domain-containing protein 3B [Schistosoma japonicum]
MSSVNIAYDNSLCHKNKMDTNEDNDKIKSLLKIDAAVNRQLGSKAWLSIYGLKHNNIDKTSVLQNIGFSVKGEYYNCLRKYVKSCYGDNLFVRVTNDKTGDVYNITAKKGYIKQLRVRIKQAADMYRSRLAWLTSGSRSIFGVIQEHSAVFLLDIKTQSPETFNNFIDSLKHLASEQIVNMRIFSMIRCQDEPNVFSADLVSVDCNSLHNLLKWISNINRLSFFSANCTTDCIARVNKFIQSFESVYLITEGESSMTSPVLLENAIKTLKYPLHIISYCCENMKTIEYLNGLCTYTSGRFHAYCINMHIPLYLPSCWDVERFQQTIHVKQIEYGGPPKGWGQHEDCVLIFEELEEAQSLLQRIDQVLREIERIPNEILQDINSQSDQPASITNNCEFGRKREEHMSSKEWLSIHGLKAQHLDFYDLLASVSFKHCDGVVNVLKPPLTDINNNNTNREYCKIYDEFEAANHLKPDLNDSSQVWASSAIIQPKLINAQYCCNFVHVRWKDGTIVHVQVTPEMYRSYSRRMQSRLNAIKHRLDLLRHGSRELFEKLIQLINEQIKHKSRLNLVSFNSTINAWSDHLQSTDECNLKSAIKWIEALTCGGTTNTLKALQFALDDNLTEGIYLLTDGRPNQQPHTILLSMHLINRVPIHTISFNCNDSEANEFLIRLAQESGGRFHYYNEFPNDVNQPKQWESEDVRLLEDEYQLGLNNLEKLAQLKDECYLLRMKANKIKPNSTHDNKPIKLTTNKKSLSNKLLSTVYAKVNSTHSTNDSQFNLTTTTDCIVDTITKEQVECLHYPTVLTNHSKTNKSQKLSIKKKPKKKMSTDAYYPNLQNLHKIFGDEKDFVLCETKQLLERQKEMLMHKANQKVDSRQGSDILYTIPDWLSHHSLTAKKLRLNDLLKSFTVRLRPTYIPALGHHVVSEVLKQTLPIAYVHKNNFTNSPEIRLLNPLAINFEQYEKNLRNALYIIEKKLIEIIFEYIDSDSLNDLRENVNLVKYTKWKSKLCWYQDNGQNYLNEIKHLKEKRNSSMLIRSSKQINSTFYDRAPCGHPYRRHNLRKIT